LGGGGPELGRARGLSCAKVAEAEQNKNARTKKNSADETVNAAETEILDGLVTGGVVAGLVVDAEGREPFGSA